MIRRFIFVFALALLLVTPPLSADVDYWKVDDLKIGMTGYGLTVFHGHEPEKFFFKITGFNDTGEGKQLMISLWREVNGKKKEINVAAGMSGSPLFVGGKLVGAVAAGWQANTEGIARPFQFMYEEQERAERFKSLYRRIPKPPPPLLPASRKLKPGSSIKIGFVSGDPDLTAYSMGTVTAVDRESGILYALGHSIAIPPRNDSAQGPISYSAWEGAVAVTINSGHAQKVAARDESEGQYARIWYNGVHGIYGTLDEVAEMVPLELEVVSANYAKKVECYIPYGGALLGFSGYTALSFLNNHLEPLGEGIVYVEGDIVPEGKKALVIKERFPHFATDTSSFSSIFGSRSSYFASLGRLVFADQRVRLKRLRLRFTHRPSKPIFEMQDLTVLKSSVEPGGTFSVAVQIIERGTANGASRRFEPVVSFRIPEDTPPGLAKVFVETGEAFADRRPEALIPPKDTNDLIGKIAGEAKDNDALYVTVLLPPAKEEDQAPHPEPPSWDEMQSGDTRFYKSWRVLDPIRIPGPEPDAVVSGRSGRLEGNFTVVPKPQPPWKGFLSRFMGFLIAGIGLPLMYFICRKLYPYLDTGWRHGCSESRAARSELRKRWRSFRLRSGID